MGPGKVGAQSQGFAVFHDGVVQHALIVERRPQIIVGFRKIGVKPHGLTEFPYGVVQQAFIVKGYRKVIMGLGKIRLLPYSFRIFPDRLVEDEPYVLDRVMTRTNTTLYAMLALGFAARCMNCSFLCFVLPMMVSKKLFMPLIHKNLFVSPQGPLCVFTAVPEEIDRLHYK